MNITARLLDSITAWPQDDELANRCKSMGQTGKSFRNCYLGLGYIWQVKMYLGGEQRIIGETFDCLRAVRFADMALLYFAKYRKRRARPTVDSDLNFGVASATRDTDAVPQAKQILVSLELQLLAKGLIGDDSRPFVDNRTAAQVCRDLRVAFRSYRLATHRARVLVGTVPGADIAFDMAGEAIQRLETLNISLDRYLAQPPANPTTAHDTNTNS
jgi:hypothetical protein